MDCLHVAVEAAAAYLDVMTFSSNPDYAERVIQHGRAPLHGHSLRDVFFAQRYVGGIAYAELSRCQPIHSAIPRPITHAMSDCDSQG